MATIGEQILTVQDGYTRYDNTDSKIKYCGTGWQANTVSGYNIYQNTFSISTVKNDYISINSYIINLISSGRTLADAMECYIKNVPSIGEPEREKFLEYLHNNYDASFAYRLLCNLRNYSQHGHLPVSSTENKYYFDLKQIVDKPHFNLNSGRTNEIKSIIKFEAWFLFTNIRLVEKSCLALSILKI